DYQGLRDLYDRRIAAASEPTELAPLYFERGVLRIERLKDQSGASADFEIVLTHDPGHLEALRRLGELYVGQQRPGEALELWERFFARTDDPMQVVPVHRQAAEICEQQGDLTGALGHFERVLAKTPDDDDARRRMVGLYLKQASYPAAIELLRV